MKQHNQIQKLLNSESLKVIIICCRGLAISAYLSLEASVSSSVE